MPAPLVLVRRAVHVAARLGSAVAPDRRPALSTLCARRILGDDRFPVRPGGEAVLPRQPLLRATRCPGTQALLEPRQRLGIRRYLDPAGCHAGQTSAAPALRKVVPRHGSAPARHPEARWLLVAVAAGARELA